MLRSIVITSAVSLGIAVFLTNFNINFWTTVAFVTVLQIVGWNIFTYYANIQLATEARKLDEKMIEEMSRQQTTLPCAYCNAPNSIDIRLDQTSDFECTTCNKENAVYIDIETAQRTEPVDTSVSKLFATDE